MVSNIFEKDLDIAWNPVAGKLKTFYSDHYTLSAMTDHSHTTRSCKNYMMLVPWAWKSETIKNFSSFSIKNFTLPRFVGNWGKYWRSTWSYI